MLSIFLLDSLPLDGVIERLTNVARCPVLASLIGVNIYGIVGIYQIISAWMTLEVTVRWTIDAFSQLPAFWGQPTYMELLEYIKLSQVG